MTAFLPTVRSATLEGYVALCRELGLDAPALLRQAGLHPRSLLDPQTPLDLTGRRILVVGIGNSAADIAVELSSKTLSNEVTLSTRSGAWIVPKYIAGRPGDAYWRTYP